MANSVSDVTNFNNSTSFDDYLNSVKPIVTRLDVVTDDFRPVVYEEIKLEYTGKVPTPGQEKALAALTDWLVNWKPKPSKRLGRIYTLNDTARLWGEAYILCGDCKRGWDLWFSANPVGENLQGWLDLAATVVTENKWVT